MTANTNAAIRALKASGLAVLPPVAIVLGTGLGSLADAATNATAVAYPNIPGPPIPTVEGHAGRLVVGDIEGRRVTRFFRAAAIITSAAILAPWQSRSRPSARSAADNVVSP